MSLTLMLFRDVASGDRDALAHALWDEDGEAYERFPKWSAEEREILQHNICEFDTRVPAPAPDAKPENDSERFLSTETEPGVDYLINETSVIVDIDAAEPDLPATRALVSATLDALDRLCYHDGLLAWSIKLGHIVDIRRDRAELEALYRRESQQYLLARRLPRLLRFVLPVLVALIALVTVLAYLHH